MGKNSRCVIGVCNNDKRYPQHYVKHSNVKGDIIMHALLKDGTVRKIWVQQILKGRKILNQRRKSLTIALFVRIISMMDGQQKAILHPVYF